MIIERSRVRRRQVLLVSALTAALVGSAAGAIGLSWSWEQWLLWSVVVDVAVGLAAVSLPVRGSVAAAGLAVTIQVGAALSGTGFEDRRFQSVPMAGGWGDAQAVGALAGLAVIVAWLVGRSLREHREHTEALRASAAAEAVASERLRLARDLHDLVAHSIGVIAIQAGVGRRVIDSRPEAARGALEAIEAMSRDTLAGLRRTVATLRRAGTGPDSPPASTPGLADVDDIVAAAGVAGLRVEVRRVGPPRPLPADVDLAGYRIVQEAVTNAVRHSGASECHVTVEYRDDALLVEVRDTGRGGPVRAGGFGIIGMRERAALLGGDLVAGPRPEGGFQVRAHLPMPNARAG